MVHCYLQCRFLSTISLSLSFLCASTIILHILSIILHLPSIIERYHLLFSIRIYKEQVREEVSSQYTTTIILSSYSLQWTSSKNRFSQKKIWNLHLHLHFHRMNMRRQWPKWWHWSITIWCNISQYDATIRTDKLCILAQLVADDVLGIAQTILACWKSNWGRKFFFSNLGHFFGDGSSHFTTIELALIVKHSVYP